MIAPGIERPAPTIWRTDRGGSQPGVTSAWRKPLIAGSPVAPYPARRSRSFLTGGGLTSILVHGAVLLCLVPVPGRHAVPMPPPEQRSVQMEFIEQAPTIKGAPPPADNATKAPTGSPAAAPPEAASPAPAASVQAVPVSSATSQPHWQSSMLEDPGNAERDEDPYTVRASDGITPAKPDAAYRNMPPRYPADAARQGLRGTVAVVVHVTPDGRAGDVQVVSGSGVPSLDHETVRALSRWRFEPQMDGGVAVPSEFRIAVHYDGETR